MLPVVAIVGRPNVGKSSLLNRISGRTISIVDPTPGVTRDRVSTTCRHEGRYFELVDTGGLGLVDADHLEEHVEEQIRLAVEQASIILFVLDAREGVVPLDERVATMLRPYTDKVVLLANKIDAPDRSALAAEFFRLGFGEPLEVSARHGRGIGELLDRIAALLAGRGLGGDDVAGEAAEPEMKLAIVGKRNAGKSTLINAIAGSPRVITSETPGTTRDSIDVRFVKDGRTFLAIDTAGIRKRGKIKGDVEFYSFARAQRSIRRADVVLLLIDATEPVGSVDKKLGRYIAEQFKPVILVINKFDLVAGRAVSGDYAHYLGQVLPGLDYAPIATTTATEARNVQSVLDLANQLFKQSATRVSTAQLNETVERITGERGPGSSPHGGPARIYYATQVAVRPPTLVLFVNDPRKVTPSFEHYLINRFRELLPFKEVPIRLLVRERSGRHSAGDEAPARPRRRASSSPTVRPRRSGPPRRPGPPGRPGRRPPRRPKR